MVFVCFSRVKKLHTAPLMTSLKHSKPELNSLADCFLRLQQILDTHWTWLSLSMISRIKLHL